MKTYRYTIDGAAYDVTINSISGQKAQVEVNGIPFEVEMQGSQLTEDALPNVSAEAVQLQPQLSPWRHPKQQKHHSPPVKLARAHPSKHHCQA